MARGKSSLPHAQYELEKLFNWIIFWLLTATIIWGCLLNSRAIKYSKIYPKDLQVLPKPFQQCLSESQSQSQSKATEYQSSLLVGLNLPNSYICCNSSRKDDLICLSSNDALIRWLSSSWAWLIPFLPLLLTLFTEILEYYFPTLNSIPATNGKDITNNNSNEFSNPIFHLLKENHSHRLVTIFLKAFFRGIVYLGIILVRVYVLYLIPYYLVNYALDQGILDNSVKCWCPHLVSTRKCQLPFDYSDHIVLSVVQYIFPTLLEINYLLYNKLTIAPNQLSSSSSSNTFTANIATTSNSSSWSLSPTRSFNWKSIYLLPFLSSILFVFVNLRLVLFTTLFYHTPLENLVGYLIASLSSFFWLFSSKGLKLWLSFTN